MQSRQVGVEFARKNSMPSAEGIAERAGDGPAGVHIRDGDDAQGGPRGQHDHVALQCWSGLRTRKTLIALNPQKNLVKVSWLLTL